jgi:putative endonuclease
MTKKETGDKGEELARILLAEKGMRIMETNWQYKKLEVDIIAETKDLLVFIEVKTRTVPFLLEPELAVTLKKQKYLIDAANAYISEKNIDKEVRFDIVSVIIKDKKYLIEHIENAFYPKVK